MARILIKNGQNCCFLKTLWPKLQNVLSMVIFTMIGDSQCLECSDWGLQIVGMSGDSKCLEGNAFFPKISDFAVHASFDPKTAISAMNLKLRVPD